jgi:large subunit ribosomal protein L17
MRHRIHQRKLNRTTEHRKALLRNMAQNLVEHGRITTTLPKAKALRPYFERLVTLAVKTRKLADADDQAGALRARRRIHQLLGDRGLIPAEHRSDYDGMSDARRARTMRMASGRRYRTGDPKGRLVFTAESVSRRLIEKVAPRFEDRPGGYTRLVRLATRRLGDAAPLAVLQLVGDEEAPLSVTKPGKLARHRRADARYAMAIKASKEWRERPASPASGDEPADDTPADPDGAAANEAGTDET